MQLVIQPPLFRAEVPFVMYSSSARAPRVSRRARRRSPDLAETLDRRSPWSWKWFGDSGDLRSDLCGVGRPAHSACRGR